MNTIKILLPLLLLSLSIHAQSPADTVTQNWIQKSLATTSPKLILTPALENTFKQKLKSDKATQLAYQLLLQRADALLDTKPLERKQIGKRLLSVSREAVRRLSTLSLAYRIAQREDYLKRIEQELLAVSEFKDWNPSHFLDVAEMSMAVAVALDWCGAWLSDEVKKKAKTALIEKGLKQSIAAEPFNWWVDAYHNWNLVCHGGMSMAAIAVFEEEPEIASLVLNRAVEKIPLGLTPYAPDGIYPEGPSYWFYATHYLTIALSSYETALATDFELTNAQGFLESAMVSEITAGATGRYYNFFDGSENGYHSLAHFGLLAWFAHRSSTTFDETKYIVALQNALASEGKGSRFYAFNLLNIVALDEDKKQPSIRPTAWAGEGESPIIVFRSAETTDDLFLAAKGGRAADNHGNMDVGSFIFELDGVRWSIDPGNQNYNDLEQLMGGELWNRGQDSKRWTLLTKNNYGHSTLTINGAMHLADARSILIEENLSNAQPSATFDLTPVFGATAKKVHRTFKKLDSKTVEIKDEVDFSKQTQTLTWQMMTQATVKEEGNELLLMQDGKQLKLSVVQPADCTFKIVSLTPPPLEYDKTIPNLKRIEINMERKLFNGASGAIIIQLTQL